MCVRVTPNLSIYECCMTKWIVESNKAATILWHSCCNRNSMLGHTSDRWFILQLLHAKSDCHITLFPYMAKLSAELHMQLLPTLSVVQQLLSMPASRTTYRALTSEQQCKATTATIMYGQGSSMARPYMHFNCSCHNPLIDVNISYVMCWVQISRYKWDENWDWSSIASIWNIAVQRYVQYTM